MLSVCSSYELNAFVIPKHKSKSCGITEQPHGKLLYPREHKRCDNCRDHASVDCKSTLTDI